MLHIIIIIKLWLKKLLITHIQLTTLNVQAAAVFVKLRAEFQSGYLNVIPSTRMMEAAHFSDTSVLISESTGCHIPVTNIHLTPTTCSTEWQIVVRMGSLWHETDERDWGVRTGTARTEYRMSILSWHEVMSEQRCISRRSNVCFYLAV